MQKAYIKYIVSLILFGSNGIVASFILLPSNEIVLSRSLIGGVFLVVVFLFSRRKAIFFEAGRQSLWLVISGISMGASWMFLYEAYQQIGVSIATLAYYTGPVIVMVLAPIVFHEKMTSAKAIGFIAVLIGMVCVNGIGVMNGESPWGLFCGIMAAITYSFMVIFNKKATKITGIENAMWQLVFGCVIVAVFTFFQHSGEIVIPAESIFPMLLLGVVNTGFGCYLYFSSIKELSAQSVSILGYLEPLSALGFSALFLGERLTVLQGIGAVLILGGAAFGELFRRNARVSKKGDSNELGASSNEFDASSNELGASSNDK